MVSWFHLSTIMVLVIVQIHLPRGANEDCMDAVNNAEIVESCPTSKKEWDIASRRKNCSKLAAEAERKNCTMNEKQPEYHCLINALRNKLLEVCGPGKTIFGYCTEFNEAGKVIQNHYTAPCKDVSPKCDKSYKSSDAYKYPGCYKLVNKIQDSTGDPEFGYHIMGPIITTCVIVIVLCMVAVVLCLRRRKEKIKRERDSEKQHSLMKTATEKTINKGADSKPSIQYLVCEINKFQHLNCSNKQIKGSKQRILGKKNISNDLTDKVTKGGFVKFGVIGEFTNQDLKLFPKGAAFTCEEYEKKHPSESVPVLCFQNNLPLQPALEACKKENACHLILVQPVQDVADKADGFIIFVDRNKKTILEAITSCLEQPLCNKSITPCLEQPICNMSRIPLLEQPLCNMSQESLHLYSEDSFIHVGEEAEPLHKERLNQTTKLTHSSF